MNSGIAGMTTNPMAMLLGLGVKVSNATPAASGEFGELLCLFPQMASLEDILPGEAVSGEVPKTASDAQSLGNFTVTIPQDMAQMLGLGTISSSGTTAGNESESTMQVQAELLTAGTENDQIVYLKILPTEAVDGTALSAATEEVDANANDQGVILPIRLRTVEQNGDQLTADADLLTAAGKDVSVRIRLELSGNLEANQSLVQNSSADKTVTSESVPAASQAKLTQLLGDLNVSSMAIEYNADATTKGSNLMSTSTLFSETTPIFRKVSGLKITSAATVDSQKTTGVETPNLVSTVTSAKIDSKLTNLQMKSEDTTADLTDTSDSKSDLSAVIDSVTSNGKEAALKDAGLTEKAVSASTSTTGFSSSSSSSTATTSDTATVRFFDLDHKLDQLKSNSGQRIKIQLVPAQLGKMELTIASQRGQVTVNLALDSVQAKQAVEKNLNQLESQLAASGIKVDNFQITVNQSSKGNAFAQYQNSYQQSGFSDQKRDGSSNYQAYTQKQLNEFNLTEADFAKVMVNCLA